MVAMHVRYSFLIAVLAVKSCSAGGGGGCFYDSDCSGGTCVSAKCDCPSGQYGPFCTSPCATDGECNGGFCTRSYECDCPPLQTGENCENRNECDTDNACVEGLECDQTYEPFTCVQPASPTNVTMDDISNSGSPGRLSLSTSVQMLVLVTIACQ